MNEEQKNIIKRDLFERLKEVKAFWSYSNVRFEQIRDYQLIEKVMLYLDFDDICKLYLLYSPRQIKSVWKEFLCPLEVYHQLNKMFALVLFDIKNPERYMKAQTNRIIKSRINARVNV